jgi:hypothetical protein
MKRLRAKDLWKNQLAGTGVTWKPEELDALIFVKKKATTLVFVIKAV